MKLIVVRHGQTDWNKVRKLQGLTDIQLNENGRQVAIDLGDKLEQEGVTFDEIFSSPLIRAYEIDKYELTEVSLTLCPAAYNDFTADIFRTKLTAVVGSFQTC